MADYLEYIDAYFSQTPSNEEVKRFEQLLAEDKDFAQEVAFYLSSKQVLKDQLEREKKEHFKQLLANSNSLPVTSEPARVRKLWIYRAAAAASIISAIIISWYLFYSKPISVKELADTYIQQNLARLDVKMGTSLDSIQQGLKLYNEGQLSASQKMFESITQNDTSNYSVKKYLGIVYLRLANYDKALLYFQQLENYPLYSNPAIFYQALTLMKRNLPGDKTKAKQLLQQVVDGNLEGKLAAQQWLKNW